MTKITSAIRALSSVYLMNWAMRLHTQTFLDTCRGVTRTAIETEMERARRESQHRSH